MGGGILQVTLKDTPRSDTPVHLISAFGQILYWTLNNFIIFTGKGK